MKDKIWLSPPHLNGNELVYLKQALDSNWLAPYGENLDAFEHQLRSYFGVDKEIALLNSGTSALHIALLLCGVIPGDSVLCQSSTFVASANAICYVGANPVFIDSERETWNMCPNVLEEAISRMKTHGKIPKALVVVHSYGMPAKMDEIVSICQNNGILVIEDAASALGSEYKGRKCGTIADFGVISFNSNKIVTTSGGGALICPNLKLKEKAIMLASQARLDARHYEHQEVGYNYRMSNLEAGLGRAQMEMIDDKINLKKHNHLFYHTLVENIPEISLLEAPSKDFKSNYWLNCILCKENQDRYSRDELIDLFQKNNIETRPIWKPMHIQKAFKSARFFGGYIATNLFEQALCLPSGSNLSNSEKEHIQKTMDGMQL